MPWCAPCSRFFNPGSVGSDGVCPDCGGDLTPDQTVEDPSGEDGSELETSGRGKVPWHFWVGVVAMVVYLSWRLIQGIIWLVH